jgi:hypothetical protein
MHSKILPLILEISTLPATFFACMLNSIGPAWGTACLGRLRPEHAPSPLGPPMHLNAFADFGNFPNFQKNVLVPRLSRIKLDDEPQLIVLHLSR